MLRTPIGAGMSFSEGSKEPKDIFRQADKALYRGKDHGRKGCAFRRDRNK